MTTWQTTLQRGPRGRDRQRAPALRVVFSPGEPLHGRAARKLEPGALEIGRAVAAEQLPLRGDLHLSRLHARLEVGRDGVRLHDVSSTGSFVNGQRVAQAELQDGDVIRLGDSFLVFRTDFDEQPDAEVAGMIGDAPAMRAARRILRMVGRSSMTVLVLGETGTGKEIAARALHAASARSGPFVAVNCAAIPDGLAEAHLFGHVAGSYTGAKRDAPGVFRAAAGGTLLLDEIGDLALPLQAKLLRALETRSVMPVGGTQEVPCDTRVVAATHRDLLAAVEAGAFRADLYARLAEFTVELPPLRARREDILPLLASFLPEIQLDPELVEALLLHAWPFNVRELRRVAKQLELQHAPGRVLGLDQLEPHVAAALIARGQRSDEASPPGVAPAQPVQQAPQEASPNVGETDAELRADVAAVPTREALIALLERHRGSVADIARETRRSRKQVYRWLERHQLDVARFRS